MNQLLNSTSILLNSVPLLIDCTLLYKSIFLEFNIF
ncbi:hypothetical protein MNBD_GAMMA06-639 [hydrothermal vent metagenome]|uniref:Uncharacterized protein n=1 Tax=hydrothermal vent metagenome TaxID=652676 RepID=A0A3B0WRM9_9ZZZZ